MGHFFGAAKSGAAKILERQKSWSGKNPGAAKSFFKNTVDIARGIAHVGNVITETPPIDAVGRHRERLLKFIREHGHVCGISPDGTILAWCWYTRKGLKTIGKLERVAPTVYDVKIWLGY